MAGITLCVVCNRLLQIPDLQWLFFRGPLLYSYVIQNLSWQMGFWFVTIPLGLSILLVFFFVPEVRKLLRQLFF